MNDNNNILSPSGGPTTTRAKFQNISKKGQHHIGRPPSDFRKLANIAFWEADTIKLLVRVVIGDPILQPTHDRITVVETPASLRDRVEAAKILKEWAYGSSEVIHNVNLDFVYSFVSKLSENILKILSPTCPHCNKNLSHRDDTIKMLEILADDTADKKVEIK